MKIIKYISLTFLFIALALNNSCNVDKLELTNPNGLNPSTYFESQAQVQSAVNAAYGNLQAQGLYNRYIWFSFDNMSHENVGLGNLEGNKRDMLNYTFTPTLDAIQWYWESCYIGINKANFVIENAEKISEIPSDQMTDQMKNKFLGEARFMRALYYFYLVQRFGGVPLVLNTPKPTDNGAARATVAEVYAQIETDLTFAANNCLTEAAEADGRATSGAAWALLGKVRLYQQNYTGAMTAFNNVTGYSLVNNYYDLFMEETEHNSEIIFAVEFNLAAGYSSAWNSQVTDGGVNEACFRAQEYGCLNWWNVNPGPDLVDEFEAGDPRLHDCIYQTGDVYNNGASVMNLPGITQSDGSHYPRPGWKKYQNYYKLPSEQNNESGINMSIIRYADVLLMMAECQANLGNIGNQATVGSAVELMNRVRLRPSTSMPLYGSTEMDDAGYPVGNLAQFMVALEHERKVELCGEQVRLPDLVRWGRLTAFIAEVQPTLPLADRNNLAFAPYKILWPIPQAEINTNPAIVQNPGW